MGGRIKEYYTVLFLKCCISNCSDNINLITIIKTVINHSCIIISILSLIINIIITIIIIYTAVSAVAITTIVALVILYAATNIIHTTSLYVYIYQILKQLSFGYTLCFFIRGSYLFIIIFAFFLI